jgi:hypothetical protein
VVHQPIVGLQRFAVVLLDGLGRVLQPAVAHNGRHVVDVGRLHSGGQGTRGNADFEPAIVNATAALSQAEPVLGAECRLSAQRQSLGRVVDGKNVRRVIALRN